MTTPSIQTFCFNVSFSGQLFESEIDRRCRFCTPDASPGRLRACLTVHAGHWYVSPHVFTSQRDLCGALVKPAQATNIVPLLADAGMRCNVSAPSLSIITPRPGRSSNAELHANGLQIGRHPTDSTRRYAGQLSLCTDSPGVEGGEGCSGMCRVLVHLVQAMTAAFCSTLIGRWQAAPLPWTGT
jgi:hypothetical protein